MVFMRPIGHVCYTLCMLTQHAHALRSVERVMVEKTDKTYFLIMRKFHDHLIHYG